MYVEKKYSIYRIKNYLRFQASTGGFGTYPMELILMPSWEVLVVWCYDLAMSGD